MVDASTTDGAYTGVTLRIVSGTGMGQHRNVSSYAGSTPDRHLRRALGRHSRCDLRVQLRVRVGHQRVSFAPARLRGHGNAGEFAYHRGNAGGQTSPDLQHLLHRESASSGWSGRTVPTLMRSQLDVSGGVLSQQTPVRLLDGVEALRVELGIDNTGKTGAAVNYAVRRAVAGCHHQDAANESRRWRTRCVQALHDRRSVLRPTSS